jgi:hypothetical protein
MRPHRVAHVRLLIADRSIRDSTRTVLGRKTVRRASHDVSASESRRPSRPRSICEHRRIVRQGKCSTVLRFAQPRVRMVRGRYAMALLVRSVRGALHSGDISARRMLRFIRSDRAGRKPRARATFQRTSHVVAYVDRRGGQEHWVMESAATSILTWLAQSGRANCSARRMPRPVDPRRPRRRVPTARRTHLVPRSSFYMGRNPARLFRMAAGSPSSQRCVSDHPSFRMSIALRLRSRPRKAAHYRRCGSELAPQDARSRTTCAFALQCFGIFPLAFMLRMHG